MQSVGDILAKKTYDGASSKGVIKASHVPNTVHVVRVKCMCNRSNKITLRKS